MLVVAVTAFDGRLTHPFELLRASLIKCFVQHRQLVDSVLYLR